MEQSCDGQFCKAKVTALQRYVDCLYARSSSVPGKSIFRLGGIQ